MAVTLEGCSQSISEFSRSVVSNSLQPHGLQHAMFPWPSSIFPFSSCLQSFPVSRSFPVSQFFTSGGPSIGASASATVHPGGTQATSYLWLSMHCLAQCLFHGWCTTSVGINIEKLYYFYEIFSGPTWLKKSSLLSLA